MENKRGAKTYECRSTSGMTGTRREVEELQIFVVPNGMILHLVELPEHQEVRITHKLDSDGLVIQEVYAWSGVRLRMPNWWELEPDDVPSNTTPNEPSPIFLPTRK